MKRSIARYVYALVVLMFTGFFISGCGGDGSTGHWDEGSGTSDSTAPTVSSNAPAAGAPAVAIGSSLTATFSEEMDSGTINTDSFTLQKGSGLALGPELPGQVSYSDKTAIFNPTADLDANSVYTATVNTGAADIVGNPLANDHVWTFTTDEGLVDANPTVILTTPYNLEPGVAINASVTATFSEEMIGATIDETTFTLYNTASLTFVTGTVSYVNRIATFNPTSDLEKDTEYTATISSTVEDLNTNYLVDSFDVVNDYVWTFRTGAASDLTAPTVVPRSPLDGAIDVAINKNISATFSEPMNPITIDQVSFTLQAGGVLPLGPVLPAAVSYLGLDATLNPTDNLAEGTEYTVTMTTAATDLAGNPLALDEVWTFTTIAAAVAQGPLPVDLGTAGDFAVLSKAGISNTGVTTQITGDIGVSPISFTAITGFGLVRDASGQFSTTTPTTLVNGKVYAGDYAVPSPAKMVTAINDLRTAYLDAEGRTTSVQVELYAGNLSGKTLAPGLYKWSTAVQVDTATAVTLSGSANDVWIFQISGELKLATGAKVTLDGGAQAKNIFWQVAGSPGVTLEAGSEFKGIVLAEKAIVLKTGAAVVGRLLAETDVALDTNVVTQP